MRTAELVADAAWVTLGLGICFYALTLRLWDGSGPASGFLPFIAGVFVAVVGLALFVREWARRPVKESKPPFWEDPTGRTRVALVIAGLCVMAYLMPVLGFLLTASLVMTFLLGLTERKRVVSSVVLAIVSSVATYWLFGSLLQVRLPRGLLGF